MPRLAPFVLAALALPAHADLYRWVDPETGSVKFSTSPPASMGEGVRRKEPEVQVIPSRPAPPDTSVPAVPEKPAATPAKSAATSEKPAAAPAALESTWRTLLQGMSALVGRPDFNAANPANQQQVQAYEAASAELDLRDPAGAARRRAEEAAILERARKGLQK